MVLLDGSDVVSEQDVRVIQQVVDAGRALVLVNNKWDLVDEDRQAQLKWEIEKDLAHVSWAPHINLAAKTGWHTNRLVRALDAALEGWYTRIPTARLNAFLGELQAANPHPLRGGKQPRILFGAQVQVAPPRVVLFTTGSWTQAIAALLSAVCVKNLALLVLRSRSVCACVRSVSVSNQ